MCVPIFAVITAIIAVIFTYIKWKFNYWEQRNLPYLKPSFPFGTMENPFDRKLSLGFWLKQNYDELKSKGHKHGGLYNSFSPAYIPIDPDYLKNIMQKDFDYFIDRGVFYNEKDDPLSAHLFALGGEKWRKLRQLLTPTFTSAKMKMMFETVLKCTHPMKEAMDEYIQNHQVVDIKEFVACFTTDVIGSCAFGFECNSFKSPDAEFRKYGKKTFEISKFKMMKLIFLISQPELGRFFKMTFTPKDTSDFFMKVVKDTVRYREINNIVRNDVLQLLIDLKNNNQDSLTINEIAAQAFIFFAAGFESSSETTSFCLFELATNPDIQQKVRNEIKEVLVKYNGKITYDAISEMKYMGQVIDETLRKYPPLNQITRKCVMDYKVPNTDVIIEKGTSILISPLGLHYDPEYYPNPNKFDPERFTDENKKERHPFIYIPFGEGPRMCIAFRFGIMQIKICLTVLLNNYKFSLNDKTEIPLKIDPFNIVFTTIGPIWMDTEVLD